MDKLSNEQIVELLSDGAQTIRKQASTIRDLEDKLAAKELTERAEKVASEMHSKSVRLDTPYDALVEELKKEASEGRLETIERAVQMVGPDMGKFASVSSNNDGQGNSPLSSDFERFIVGATG